MSELSDLKKQKYQENEKPKVSADDVIEALGFGPAQFVTFGFIVIIMSIANIDSSGYVFTARNTNYRCAVPECESRQPKYNESWLMNALPFEQEHATRCESFKLSNSSLEIAGNETCPKEWFDSNYTITCKDWINEVNYSIVTDFNIQCQVWKRALVGTINGVGMFVGMIYTGYLADRFGPRTLMAYTGLGCVLVRLVQSFMTEYWSFLFLEFLSPALSSGSYGIAYVLGVEMTTLNRRVSITTIFVVLSDLGPAMLGVIAWMCPYWKTLSRICYGPALVLVLCPMFTLESFRWLLVKKKWSQVVKYIEISEKWKFRKGENNRLREIIGELELRRDIQNKEDKEIDTVPILDILKYKKMLIRVVICSYCWITCTLVGYGLNLNSVSLSGNVYLNYIILILVDIPCLFMFNIVLRFVGRKKSQCVAFACCTIMCVIYAFVPLENPTIAMAVYILAKFFISLAFNLIYMFTAEVFPTSMRNSCLIFCSMIARIGNIVAPQTAVLAEGSPGTLLLAYGGITVVAALLTLLLPETRGKTLPDNISDAVKTGEK